MGESYGTQGRTTTAVRGAVPCELAAQHDVCERIVPDALISSLTYCFPFPSCLCSVFLLDLLAAIEPRAINPSIPTAGESEEDKQKNAKYIISVARKLGATVFLTWEDIVDVKPKMLMTLVASIMHTAQQAQAAGAAAAGSGAK